MIAILMDDQGLFAPLWVGVGIMGLASIVNFFYLIEPGQIKIDKSLIDDDSGDDDEDDENAPTEVDRKTMIHILIGAFTDTVGSKALFPICLSPLAFEQFYQDFVDRGEDPIMPLNTYKWLTVLVALMVIPSTFMTPKVFDKIGLAGGCVAGNFFTGVLTIILLVMGSIEPPTKALFGGFVACMYLGYPFTVMSQLVRLTRVVVVLCSFLATNSSSKHKQTTVHEPHVGFDCSRRSTRECARHVHDLSKHW